MLKNYFNLSNLEKDKKYLIAFSGGPDSTFLFFHCLKNIKKENIVVAHVNYNLRSEAKSAEKLVVDYCEKNNVSFFIKNVLFKKDKNLEEWAREERYDFFWEIASKEKCDAVLIAHNLDDSIETYILQKERSNIVRYYGLKAESKWKKLPVIRPMLNVTKKDVLYFIKSNNLIVDYDKTNDDIKYNRNRIRKLISYDDFPKYKNEMDSKNRMISWVYEKITPFIKKEFFINWFTELNDKEELVFVYEYLKTFVPEYNISNIKKSITKEICKQLRSDKAYVRIIINKDYSIIKDRDLAYLLKNKNLNVTIKISSTDDLQKVSFAKNIEEIKSIYEKFGVVIVSNDFLSYQSKLSYKNTKISKIYTKRKTTYLKKTLFLVAYRDGEINILNKYI